MSKIKDIYEGEYIQAWGDDGCFSINFSLNMVNITMFNSDKKMFKKEMEEILKKL